MGYIKDQYWDHYCIICRDIDIENLQDDNMVYISTEVDEFMEPLEQALVSLLKRFEHNLLKGNDEKVTLNIDILT